MTPATPRPWAIRPTSRAGVFRLTKNGLGLDCAAFVTDESVVQRYADALNAVDDPEAVNAIDQLRGENTAITRTIKQIDAQYTVLRAEHAEMREALADMVRFFDSVRPGGRVLRTDADVDKARALLAKMDGAK